MPTTYIKNTLKADRFTGSVGTGAGATAAAGAFTTVTASTSATVGSSGTPITQVVVYSQTLTPAAVAAATVAEQTFTVTGLATTDKVFINGPADAGAVGVAGVRVSAANTLAIRFVNPTAGALTPASGAYNIVAMRS